MKKFKFLCTVVAVVLAVGMFATTAMAASFATTTTYTASGDAAVTTVVSGITEEEVGSQVTYVAYKNGVVTTGDNILYIDQRAVASQDNITFSYSVPKAEFKGVTQTTIGLGSSVAAPTAADTEKVIDGCTVTITPSVNGTIALTEADAKVYPGNTAALTITPAEGYEIETLTVNGEEVEIAIGATSYALAVEADTVVAGTFREVAVEIVPEVGGELTGAVVETLAADTVASFFEGTPVDLTGIAGLANVAVKSVVGKLVGNEASFADYEFGLRVTYDDDTTEDFPAIQLNDDNAFAVRLIDTTAAQDAFQAVVDVAPYIVKR